MKTLSCSPAHLLGYIDISVIKCVKHFLFMIKFLFGLFGMCVMLQMLT
jgi:hypothetical protein